MHGGRRLRPLLCAAVVFAAVAGCGLFGGDDPAKALGVFTAAWSAGDDNGAAAATDAPQPAAQLMSATRKALGATKVTVTAGEVRTATDKAAATLQVAWDIGQGRTWSYSEDVELVRADKAPEAQDGWAVHWAPTVLHPKLGSRQQLAITNVPADAAPIVDRAGVPLLSPGTVVSVLLDPAAAGNLAQVAGALATALHPIDDSITAQSITAGATGQKSYTVAALRQADYTTVKPAIYDLPGVRFVSSQRLLPPSPGYAQQVLNPIRNEMSAQLTGTPGWTVAVEGADGSVITTLEEHPPKAGTTVGVALDRAVQDSAEDAVEALPQQAMIVAVAPSTGEVLAVAQNPPADAAGALALTGRYPPGSTFKMVTAIAALATGKVTPDTPVACPGTITIGGRPIPNENSFDLGTVPLRTAFAKSCNTTFAQLGSTLAPDALPVAAMTLGIGADYAVPGLTTITGAVPPAADLVQRAENSFGQGQVIVTPLGMALAAATVVHGAPVVPQFVRGQPTTVTKAATNPDPALLTQLRTMMRAVVTDGTATELKNLGEVYGKTGTAEFTDNGHAHGWFVGYRGDLAFAVLVVDAGTSSVAVDVAAKFLTPLP